MNTLSGNRLVRSIPVIIAVVLLAPGCATHVTYPDEWARIESQATSKTCSPILGDYSQNGIAMVTKGPFWNSTDETKPSLLSNLLGIHIDPPAAVTHVSLNLSAAEPGVSIWIGNEPVVSRTLEKDELSCASGIWQLDLEWMPWGSSGILLDMGVSFTSLHVYKADDDSLVIRKNRNHYGTAALLPLYMKEENWHRFLPVTQAEKHTVANAPHGVLPKGSPFARLLPPATHKDRQKQEEQHRCLETAMKQSGQPGDNLTPAEEPRLQGRSTQAFLGQSRSTAEPYQRHEFVDRTRGWSPSTKSSMLRKPHWLDPGVADRYVLCLFDTGYVWEDVTGTDVEKTNGEY